MNTELLVSNIKNASICVHNVENAEKDSFVDWHIHDEYEIYMCLEEGKTFYVGEKKYPLKKGDVILVNENVPHKTETASGCRGFLIQLKPEYDAHLHVPKGEVGAYVFGIGNDVNRQISACLHGIIEEYGAKESFYEDFIRAEVCRIFAVLYRKGVIKTAENYCDAKGIERVMPVLNHIAGNYSASISLSEMSELLNVDKAHFCRIFKSATGTTLVDYINYVRVMKAGEFLVSGKMQVSEIAESVGFSSDAYFCKLFKRYKACTPTQYRKFKGM